MIKRKLRRLLAEVFLLQAYPLRRKFQSALQQPGLAQERHLQSILKQAEGTEWSVKFGLEGSIRKEAFRERVPVSDPSKLSTWTDAIAAGRKNVLFRGKTLRLVPTSGTTGPQKWIPMNRHSRAEYARAIQLWLENILRKRGSTGSGSWYLATSPAIDCRHPAATIPSGFAGDADYVGALTQLLLSPRVVVPPKIASLKSEAWRQETRRLLMEAKDLSLLSLWHPSYLDALFNDQEKQALAQRWSKIEVISTWSDGACSGYAESLMQSFPESLHQPKGLFLTEGAITIPYAESHPLALLSGYFEFEDDEGRLLGVEEIQAGSYYRPVITNHAGLYRYRTGDRVIVTGYLEATPCLRWTGRCDNVSDMRGEKLSEDQVEAALAESGLSGMSKLVANHSAAIPHYEIVSKDRPIEQEAVEHFEALLYRNPHYRWARELGQLGEIRAVSEAHSILGPEQKELQDETRLHRKEQRLVPAHKVLKPPAAALRRR